MTDRSKHLVLSPKTQLRLEILFGEDHRFQAMQLLIEECGNHLPFCENLDEQVRT